tara:strand:- start:1359 stop:2201 length:843 start_codon:yes stop_codon:yes gene_type:complete
MSESPSQRSIVRTIDHLLRGGYTRPEDLAGGRVGIPTGTLLIVCLVMGAFYGAMMGLYGTTTDHSEMVFASAVKVPLLFLLTLFVTLPSLYVFSALARSHLRGADTLRLLLVAVAVNMVVLASFGPVTAFFTFSTNSYLFIKLLNVLFFGIAGIIGLGFLRRALVPVMGKPPIVEKAAVEKPAVEMPALDVPYDPALAAEPVVAPQPSPTNLIRTTRPPANDPAKGVFRAWIVIYGIVGAQMGWILRPFIGAPSRDFQWFRARESNFLGDVLNSLRDLVF